MNTTTTHTQPTRTLHRVTLITHAGHRVTGTVLAYDATDAKTKARNMMRANHGESHVTFTSVTAA